MSEHFRGLTVVLEDDFSAETLSAIIEAIKLIKGVASVVPGQPVGWSDFMARTVVKKKLREAIGKLLDE